MKISDFNFNGITEIREDIDFSVPPRLQRWSLNEDILTVKFENRVHLDLGWYPEFDPKGRFKLYVIKDGNWESPLIVEEANFKNFKSVLSKVLIRVQKF